MIQCAVDKLWIPFRYKFMVWSDATSAITTQYVLERRTVGWMDATRSGGAMSGVVEIRNDTYKEATSGVAIRCQVERNDER